MCQPLTPRGALLVSLLIAGATACGSENPPGAGLAPADASFRGAGVADAGPSSDVSAVVDGECSGAGAGSCATDADCDDGLACTTDLCDPCDQTCRSEIASEHCVIGGKCWAPGDGPMPCYRCVPGTSQNGLTPTPGSACDDGDPCSKDTICDDAGQCLGQAIVGCCQVAKDCDDDDPCTTDLCDTEAQTCGHESKAQCCSKGACCGVATGQVLPAGTACGEEVLAIQYKCDGVKIQRRVAHPGCDGQSADTCSKSPAFVVWTDWQDMDTCAGGKKCLLVASDLEPTCSGGSSGGACTAHADCEDYLPCTLSVCDAGKCGNFPKESGTECSPKVTSVQYGCDGFGDGSDVMVRQGHPACDGVGGACDANNGVTAWGPWKVETSCPSGTSCSVPDTTMPGTCAKGPPQTKCKPGSTCCTGAGQYAAKATKCGTSKMKKAYFCSGSGNGSDVMLKYAYSGCTGYSASCSSSTSNLNWVTETYKKCSSYQKCQVKYPSSSGTCVTGDKCKPGTTCCPDGQYASKGTKCSTYVYKKQYSCSGSGPGNTIMVQEVFKGCTGSSTSCSSSSSYLSWGPAKTYKKCSSSTHCTVSSSATSASCKS